MGPPRNLKKLYRLCNMRLIGRQCLYPSRVAAFTNIPPQREITRIGIPVTLKVSKTIFLLVTLTIFLSFLSGFVASETTVTHYFWNNDGRDCGIDICRVAAAGWPFGYIWDQDWNSPVNSADWIGVFLTVDHFDIGTFLKNTIFGYFFQPSFSFCFKASDSL